MFFGITEAEAPERIMVRDKHRATAFLI
ncbi:MAG: hypothetical protein J07AB43_11870 [Candidatus Nanosalina sp. J07AB43]|nr:MAG: hypothetical protein J07AB43_11870 [Candidatus Nanosalina sp. J07AB43]